ncbi:uncharacterized conserved protein [Serratia symbiotica]|uniref:Uncharacterized conserved protein n=1 Tax=Serratia symbiotica TaxID=138074 RepID=A0A455VEB9_9GAMM|nr:uncharacterized conserved protein [Serratia symbiotica]
MSQRGLEALLHPKSIAVLGASQQPGRAGHLMMSNQLAGGFSGPVLPVTPRYIAVCGVMAYPDIASLPLPRSGDPLHPRQTQSTPAGGIRPTGL